ncbi:Uncharacterised protein [Streptococcus pneumoniae]|nr:Uncharacterised protein [Streptococcus pneumoniae]CRG01510.1 Uncharacterised protein [Streptococcus pneumoniae]
MNEMTSLFLLAIILYGTAFEDKKFACFLCVIRSTANANIAGINKISPTVAPIDIFCCPITCLYTSVASTLYCPPTIFGAPKSVKLSVNTTNIALINPYFTLGKVTVKNCFVLLAPSILEASYKR